MVAAPRISVLVLSGGRLVSPTSLKHVEYSGNIAKTCRHFGVPRSVFYHWRAAYRELGEEGLKRKRPVPKTHPRRTPPEVEEKVLHLRRQYHLGSIRIMWYMERYHAITISESTVTRILRRNGLSRLPQRSGRRTVHTRRYNKQVPGHHIQIDVTFLTFKGNNGAKIKRYQYTAIDDAARVRALKIYDRHTQKNAINFVNHFIEIIPIRIQQIRTNRGHEFQARFHWYVEDLGIRHVYIKARTPQLNGKVERSHRADQDEFYQLLSYKDDRDLHIKLAEWEQFYNFSRPHGAHLGKTPYEAMREKLL